MQAVGLHDLRLYLPAPCISLKDICLNRGRDSALLKRAAESVGQVSVHFPDSREDVVSMGAGAAEAVLRAIPEALRGRLRYLVAGTESSVDFSKPISGYILGLLKKAAGLPLPSDLSVFQVQHACAGGMLGLLSVASLLRGGAPEDRGLVVASDIARYAFGTTAEVTQGAGAAAVTVGPNPRLLQLHCDVLGLYSEDVDDFHRPLFSETPFVKGRYSVECYLEAVSKAFADFSARKKKTPGAVLEETDLFVFHVPFVKMAERAMFSLLKEYSGLSSSKAEAFLEARDFLESLVLNQKVGNTYTASIFMHLFCALERRFRSLGPEICGKKVLFFSYGSGNTMLVWEGTVAEEAPAVLAAWDSSSLLSGGRKASFQAYEQWCRGGGEQAGPDAEGLAPGQYYLQEITETGYRHYGRVPEDR